MPDTRSDPRALPRRVPKIAAATQPPAAEVRQGDDVIDLGALAATMWRGKWRVLFWTAAAVLCGAVYAYILATPFYRATTTLVLEAREEQVVNFESVIDGVRTDSSAINTEVEILQGRLLMGRVVERLDLVADPEFNGRLTPPGPLSRLAGALRERIRGLSGNAPPPQAAPVPQAVRDRVISMLIDKVEVRNTPLSLVFTVTAQTENGAKSALIADTVARLYIEDQIAVKYDATEQATTWLAQRVTELQADLTQAESRVNAFRTATDVVDPATLELADQQMAALRARLAEQEALRASAVARAEALGSATTPEAQMVAADDALLTRLAQGGATADYQLRLNELGSAARLDVARAEAQIASLQASREALQATIGTQADALGQFQQLSREADAVRLIYAYFLNRLQETSVQQGLEQADSRILSPAVVPERAASPQKPRILAVSVVLGLMLGSVLVLLQDSLAKGFRTGRELERATGYQVMGRIPIINGRGHAGLLSYLAAKPGSAAAESVRNLRTSILLSTLDDPLRVIMTTSALPSEGKTTLALALVQNFAALQRRVLLIDGDLHGRAISRWSGAPAGTAGVQAGLIAVVRGERPLAEAVVRSNDLDADVLAAEATDGSAADVLASDGFARLLSNARALYDVVVIDTPPVLLVPDARVVAQHVDVILFVVRWNATTAGQVRDGLRMLEGVNQKATGVVLSQINTRHARRYGDGDTYAANVASYYRN